MKKPKVFYGWWIVAAGLVCMTIFSGAGFYAFSLFFRELEAAFDWGRGEFMAAFAFFFGVQALISPFIGRVTECYGPKKVITFGALIMGLGFTLVSLTSSLWHFYVAYALVGVGMRGVGFIPISALVSNWFSKRRGTALGITMIGMGLGGLVLAPVIGAYLIPNFGWSYSYLALALLTWVVVIPITLWVMKTKPQDMGLYPDGVEAPEAVAVAEASPQTPERWTPKMALATWTFWLIAVAFMLTELGSVGVVQNQVLHLTDIGFDMAIAATALGSVGIGSAIGKFGFGWLCDQIPAKYAAAISFVLLTAGVIILMNAGGYVAMWLYAILIGLGVGGWIPCMSMLTSTNFGLASYGAIFGMMSLFQTLGTAFGPVTAGSMFDAMGTYHWAFIMFLIFFAIAIAAILMVRRPKLRLESSG